MFIERPPLLYRLLFPEAVWRVKGSRASKVVYLTFDDGPIRSTATALKPHFSWSETTSAAIPGSSRR